MTEHNNTNDFKINLGEFSITDNTIVWKDRKRPIFGLPISFTRYSASQNRLFISKGLFNIQDDEVRLYRILDVKLTMSFWQRIFGVGTIHVMSSDKSLGSFDIISVKHPKEVKEALSELVEKNREAKRVSSREFMESYDDDDVNIL